MSAKAEDFYVQQRQMQTAEQTLSNLGTQIGAEKSELSAEVSAAVAKGAAAGQARDDLRRRVSLQNAAVLLECTEAELKELILRQRPNTDRAELNSMHKEQLVDRLRQIAEE